MQQMGKLRLPLSHSSDGGRFSRGQAAAPTGALRAIYRAIICDTYHVVDERHLFAAFGLWAALSEANSKKVGDFSHL